MPFLGVMPCHGMPSPAIPLKRLPQWIRNAMDLWMDWFHQFHPPKQRLPVDVVDRQAVNACINELFNYSNQSFQAVLALPNAC